MNDVVSMDISFTFPKTEISRKSASYENLGESNNQVIM